MADFADDATVRLRLLGTPYPAISLDNSPTIPRGEWVRVPGSRANKMLSVAEAKPEIPHDAIQVEVVEGVEEPVDELAEAVGPETAHDIRVEFDDTVSSLSDAQALTDDELESVKGVGPATVKKIRSASGGE